MAVSHVKSSPVADFTGTVTVFNSLGVTATTNATALVRPSDWNSAHNQFMTLSGNVGTNSTVSGSNIIFQAAGNISLFASTDTVIFSAPAQSVQTQGSVQVQGSTGSIVFSNSNNVTFGANASTITASASFNQTVQTQGSVQVQGSSGAISFGNGNGITFGGNASTITASHNGLTSQSNQAVSAANGSSAFQTLSFANGNGVTFATGTGGLGASVETSYAASNHSHGNPTLALTNLSGSTASNSAGLTLSLSAAAPGGGGATFSAGISGGNTSGNTGTVSNQIVFAGGNNITVSGSTNAGGMSVTISGANAGGAQTGISGIVVSNTTYTSGTVSFSNANGISFGSSAGQAITASYTVPTVTNSSWTVSDGATSGTVGRLAFTNLNGVTLSLSTGAGGSHTIVGSHNGLTTARASNDAIGLNSAFTAGPLAMTINSSGLSLNAASAAGTTSGFTGGASISGSMTHNTAGLALSLSHPAWITTAMQSNAATISNINISAGSTSTNASAFTFANANGITFGLGTGASVGSITASHNGLTTARASTDAIGLNTAQTNVTWTVNSSGLSLNAAGYAGTGTTFNGTNASASMTLNSNGLRLDLSAANGGGGVNTGTFYATGNTTQSSSGTIALSSIIVQGTGGISAGITNGSIVVSGPGVTSLAATGALSASSNGSTISLGVGTVTVSATSNTTQSSSGTVNLNALIFAGAGGVSAGVSNGSIVISGSTGGLTTARASNDAIGLNSAFTAGPLAMTINSSGLSLNAASAAGTTSGFTGANISASITHNTAGLAMSMSVAAPGGGGGAAISAGANSQNTGTVNFANSNGITFGLSNNGTMTASYNSTQFAGTGTTFAGANISGSLTQNSNGINMSLSVAPPGAAAENNAINLLGANTAGNTTATGSTIGWSGLNLTLSGTNASQVVISAPATSSLVGVSGVNISTNGNTISIYNAAGSYYANGQYIQGTTTQTVGQSTSVVFPFGLKEPENPAFMRMAHTVSIASTSFASTANTTYSYNQAETHNLVLYTRGTGASSQSLISVFSTSASVQMSIRLQRNSTNNISVTHALTFPNSGGTSSLSFSYAATNSTDQFSTTHMTALSGMKLWDTQFASFLDGRQYWLAYGVSTTQTTQGTANLSAARLLHSHMAMSQPNNSLGEFGLANAASNQWVPGLGSFSTAGGGTTSGFPISAVSSSSSHNLPYIQLIRIA